MMKTIIMAAAILLSASAAAAPKVIGTYSAINFDCTDQYGGDVVLTAVAAKNIETGKQIGEIYVGGKVPSSNPEVKITQYKLEGLDRRWDWDCSTKGCDFAFFIKPNGDASFYDFVGIEPGARGKPSQRFKCNKGTKDDLYAPPVGYLRPW